MKEKEPTYVIKFNVKSLSTDIWYLLFIKDKLFIKDLNLWILVIQLLYLSETESLPHHQER